MFLEHFFWWSLIVLLIGSSKLDGVKRAFDQNAKFTNLAARWSRNDSKGYFHELTIARLEFLSYFQFQNILFVNTSMKF